MNRGIFALAAGVFFAGALHAADQTERLATLGKVWFNVKYLHPYLAYKNIDWDDALIRAIPEATSARTSDEFAAAVETLLSPLSDDMTRVVLRSPERRQGTVAERMFEIDEKADGVMVLTLTSADILPGWGQVRSEFESLPATLRDAKALVFDLRCSTDDEIRRWLLMSYFDNLGPALTKRTLEGPGLRKRLHKGFPPALDFSSGGMYSAFVVKAGRRFVPAPDATEIPIVFVLNRWSAYPNVAAALQAAGKAAMVFAGEGSPRDGAEAMRIPLEDDWEAAVRLDEMIFPDGSGAVEPSERAAEEEALERALELVQGPWRLSPVKKRITAVPSWRENVTWEGIERADPYPRAEVRLLAAFQIWGVFEHFFPYRDLMDRDWWEVLKETIPKMQRAADALEYHRAVAEMTHHVHDSHLSRPSSPALGRAEGRFGPRIALRIVEGQPVAVYAAEDTGVLIGDVLRKIDGRDVPAMMQEQSRLISASTPQALHRTLASRLLRGPQDSTAKLQLEGAHGKLRIVEVRRDTMWYRANRPPSNTGPPVRVLDGNIGYVDLSILPIGKVDAMFDGLLETSAIIFDARRGGAGRMNRAIPPRLLEPEKAGQLNNHIRIPGFQGTSSLYSNSIHVEFVSRSRLSAADPNRYKGKTVLLVDERAQSAREGLANAFRVANGTTLIGAPTTGANGDTTNFVIPGGIAIKFTGVGWRYANGQQQQRVGVIPDIHVEPTIAGIRAGRDEVFERALEYLRTHQ